MNIDQNGQNCFKGPGYVKLGLYGAKEREIKDLDQKVILFERSQGKTPHLRMTVYKNMDDGVGSRKDLEEGLKHEREELFYDVSNEVQEVEKINLQSHKWGFFEVKIGRLGVQINEEGISTGNIKIIKDRKTASGKEEMKSERYYRKGSRNKNEI